MIYYVFLSGLTTTEMPVTPKNNGDDVIAVGVVAAIAAVVALVFLLLYLRYL